MRFRACAQRLSASLRSARHDRGYHVPLHFLCSTPFGITEVGTSDATSKPYQITACSTPFGITEVGTLRPLDSRSCYASCSTPFGITEVGTAARRPDARRRFRVLNAFRHH